MHQHICIFDQLLCVKKTLLSLYSRKPCSGQVPRSLWSPLLGCMAGHCPVLTSWPVLVAATPLALALQLLCPPSDSPGCCTQLLLVSPNLGCKEFSSCLLITSGKHYSSCFLVLDVKYWPEWLSSRSGKPNIDLPHTSPAVGILPGTEGPEKRKNPYIEVLSVLGGVQMQTYHFKKM